MRRFVEKPSAENAERFLASGNYLWNAGIFLFRGSTLLDLVARLQPELSRGLEEIAAAPDRLRELYGRLPADSIDYAIMEKLDGIATLPLDCGWSDLGSWEALDEILAADAAGEHRPRRHPGRRRPRQPPVRRPGDDRRAGGRGPGRRPHRRRRAGDAEGALAGGPQAGRRARRPRPRGPAVIQPATISTAAGDRTLATLSAPLPLDELVPGASTGSADWEVEIGFGKGRYLLRRCREDAGRRFLGIEVAGEYHGLFVERARRHGLSNWVALRGDALYLASAVLPAGFASALHVYFPDPWPKIRHHKRRLFDPETVDLVLRLLRRGGRFSFATDFLDYGEQVVGAPRRLSRPALRPPRPPLGRGAAHQLRGQVRDRGAPDPPARRGPGGGGRRGPAPSRWGPGVLAAPGLSAPPSS